MTPLRHISLALILSAIVLVPASASATPVLDQTYAGDGTLTPLVFTTNGWGQSPRGLAVQNDGRLLVTMALSLKFGQLAHRPVIRFNRDGSRDMAYGADGIGWVRVAGATGLTLYGLVVGPTGDAYVSGFYRRGDGEAWDGRFVARLNPNGAQDVTFGKRGAIRFPFRASAEIKDRKLLNVDPEADGRLFITEATFPGHRFEGRATLRIHSYNAGGHIERGFGVEGERSMTYRWRGPTRALARAGNLYTAFQGRNGSCAVRRYLLREGGRLDDYYGFHGVSQMITAAGAGSKGITCTDIALGAGGNVVLAGRVFQVGKIARAVIARLDASGFLDQSFGSSGLAIRDGIDYPNLITELSDGSIIAQFQSEGLTHKLVALTRDGAFDSSFGKNGMVTVDTSVLGRVISGGDTAVVMAHHERDPDPDGWDILKFTN